MCARIPSAPACSPRCLKPEPAALSQKVSGLATKVFCQRLPCGPWWTVGGNGPSAHSVWHIDIWALMQFCWLSLPNVSLGTFNQTSRPGTVPHSPRCPIHSPRILCPSRQDHLTNLSSLSVSKTKCPLHARTYIERAQRSQHKNSQMPSSWLSRATRARLVQNY